MPYTLVGYIIKKVELPQRGIRVFIIIKLAHLSYFCAEPSARRDALAQNRHCNGSIEANLNPPDGYPWHRIVEDLRGGKGKKMKEGYSKSKPALNTDFTPSSAEVDTGTDPHPGCVCHAGRKKHRSTAEERDLITRLNRIEGQIRGIKKMLEADAYCPDVLTQVAAARCAMNSFAKVLLASHIRSCVIEDLEAGREETIEELVDTVQKLLKA